MCIRDSIYTNGVLVILWKSIAAIKIQELIVEHCNKIYEKLIKGCCLFKQARYITRTRGRERERERETEGNIREWGYVFASVRVKGDHSPVLVETKGYAQREVIYIVVLHNYLQYLFSFPRCGEHMSFIKHRQVSGSHLSLIHI